MDGTDLAKDSATWRDLVNKVMKFRVPYISGYFLIS
jgi:hypothetical protein